MITHFLTIIIIHNLCRARLKPDGTRWRTGGEVKGKLANGVGSQYSHTTSEGGVSMITNADAHTSAASSRLNWLPRRFKWTRPFRRKTKSGFCACAISFQMSYTSRWGQWPCHRSVHSPCYWLQEMTTYGFGCQPVVLSLMETGEQFQKLTLEAIQIYAQTTQWYHKPSFYI